MNTLNSKESSNDIVVFTSICGGKDTLFEGQTKGNAVFVALLDKSMMNMSSDWEIYSAYDRFASSRRNSRVPKILPHQFCKAKYSIWIDGNIKLLVTPEFLVEKYLKDHDIAVFKHPIRDCIYDEAMICAKARLDDPEVIIRQVKQYEEEGFPKHRGQAECGVIIRRHTPKVEQLNNLWWSEYCTHSVRDQISFMYAVDKVGIRVNMIDEKYIRDANGTITRGGLIEIRDHLTPRTEP